MEDGCVAGMVRMIFGVTHGKSLANECHVGVGGQGVLELTEGWGGGSDSFGSGWGKGTETGESAGSKMGLAG